MKYTLISCIDSKIVNSTTFYGRFELGPWSSGQALTIANTLRRGLLSELPGTAITFVKIIGTSHEYDTLPGMRECILDILLNIKQITLKSEFKFFSPQIGFLNVKGPGIIRARDLKLPFFIKSIDPDQYIATLNHKGQLNIKFLIHSGKKYLTHTPSSKNYSKLVELLEKQKPTNLLSNNKNIFLFNKYKKWKQQRELNKKQFLSNSNILTNSLIKKKYKLINYIFDNTLSEFDKLVYNNKNNYFEKINKIDFDKIGYFPIDAIFSPIKKVNYKIEVKNSITKKETILLEIWTNGTIDPRSAIHQTVKILINLFLPLQQFKINFFNQYRTKLYFSKFNFLYFNKKIIKLTNSYFYKKKNYFFIMKNNIFLNKFIQFNNINFIFLKNNNFLNKFFYFYLITKNKKTYLENYIFCKNKKLKKSNLILSKKLKHINLNLKKYKKKDTLQKIYINKNVKKNILEFDILNLKLTSRLYFILKKININKIGDLVSFKSNFFYTFNDKIFNLEILKKYDMFELKQSLKKYGIIIINN
uniref:Plastid-encoded RNA polymerase subunit alpha n=1 Tax=Ulva compressa TaxID=63659 RepID=A0A7I6IRQ7_ULVCO|nr:DNA-directed RNA polymerase subunit alpha [Ulva compressa]ARO34806.1 DNA-directed RNA polymerase subunit alpha [Ulva compressa]QVO51121.1 DNA-directed RNA polymberase subunit alpha [Ulva compressa]